MIQPSEGSICASRENIVSIQTKCHCQQCTISTFGHKSSRSVIVYHWCLALRSVSDGMTFPFCMKKKTCRPLGWAFCFIPLYLIIFEICQPSRPAEWKISKGCSWPYVSPPTWSDQKPQLREGQVVPWLIWLIDWSAKQRIARQKEAGGKWALRSAKQTNTVLTNWLKFWLTLTSLVASLPDAGRCLQQIKA